MTPIKLILLVALIFVVYHAARFRLLINVGVRMAQSAQKFERIAPNAPMRILVIGDSTAVGTGAVDNKESTAGRLGALYPDAELINLGVNGQKLAGMLKLLNTQSGETYDLMLIQIGGNDINYRTPVDEVEKTLKEVLAKAHEISKKVVVLHTGDLGSAPIYPPFIGTYISYRTRLLRKVYLRVVPEMEAHYVDLYEAPVDELFATDLKRYYGADSFHLSGEGYGVWFDEVKKVLAK